MSKAIYAFSGDPITFGHIDIIERASKIFDEVIAAIGVNPGKQYLFGTNERVELASDAVKHLANVTVTSFTGLLADFAYENDVHVIIRGLRNSEDFNFELMLHQIGETQAQGIETFLMPCRQQLAHVSSGAVKALQLEQGLIYEYVPLNVKQKLENRISGQLVIGVTGEAGSGKSYLVNKLLELAAREDVKAFTVDLDKLAHGILERSTEPVYVNFRKKLVAHFGEEISSENGFINSRLLGQKIFSNATWLQQFNQMIYAPLVLQLRKEIYHKRGLILLESALLAETNSLFYCNNHVIAVSSPRAIQIDRLKARGYSEEKISHLLDAQFNFEQKVEAIENRITNDGFGKLYIANSYENDAEQIFKRISALLPALASAW